MLFSLLKHYLDLYISDTELKYSSLCTVSLLLYVMVLKTISPGCGVRASLMLFLFFILFIFSGVLGTTELGAQSVLLQLDSVWFQVNYH